MQLIADNVLTHYRDQGKGPIVLMLHGWQDNLSTFDGLADNLSNLFRVVRLDLPNFGGSGDSLDITSLGDYAHFLRDFKTKLNADRIEAVVGHSMGGQIAIHAVASGQLKPRKLVLMASAGIRNERRIFKTTLRLISKVLSPLLSQSLKRRFYKKLGSDYTPDLAPNLRQVLINSLSQDVQASARRIKIPTLLVYGEADQYTPPRFGERFHSLIAKSQLVTLPGAGHHLHQQQADVVASAVQEFLA